MNRKYETGYALIAVLWLSSIVALLTILSSAEIKRMAIAYDNKMYLDGYDRILEAATHQAVAEIYTGKASFFVQLNLNYASDNKLYYYKIEPEAGKVDLNFGSQTQLKQLLEALGLSNALKQRILGYLDSSKGDKGGKLFPSIWSAFDEWGLNDAERARLAPNVTVFSKAFYVDPQLAAHDVFREAEGGHAAVVDGSVTSFAHAQGSAFRIIVYRQDTVLGSVIISLNSKEVDSHWVREVHWGV